MDLLLLRRAQELGAHEIGLAVVTTLRPDGTMRASVVNAGILRPPSVDPARLERLLMPDPELRSEKGS